MNRMTLCCACRIQFCDTADCKSALRGDGSWRAFFRFRACIGTMNLKFLRQSEGSSGGTSGVWFMESEGVDASFPRRLTTPQLPRSNVSVTLPAVMRGLISAFTHRGLSPHQFTPTSGAHQAASGNGAIGSLFHIGLISRAMAEQQR